MVIKNTDMLDNIDRQRTVSEKNRKQRVKKT